jgi:hypothetical protein
MAPSGTPTTTKSNIPFRLPSGFPSLPFFNLTRQTRSLVVVGSCRPHVWQWHGQALKEESTEWTCPVSFVEVLRNNSGISTSFATPTRVLLFDSISCIYSTSYQRLIVLNQNSNRFKVKNSTVVTATGWILRSC